MTYKITDQCVGCHRCASVCPTRAISRNQQQYEINSERCNDCVGYYSVPQCWAACPTNGGCVSKRASLSGYQSVSTPSSSNYWDIWFDIYNHQVSKLKASKQPDYWQRWFDLYSQKLSQQLQAHPSVGVNP